MFNKGLALNPGFLEAMNWFDPDCYIFHDIDQLPEDDRNIYRCEENPLHLAVQTSQYGYK